VRKMGLQNVLVRLSLAVTEQSCARGIRW